LILRSQSVNVVNSGRYKAFSNGQLNNFVKSSKVRTIYALYSIYKVDLKAQLYPKQKKETNTTVIQNIEIFN